MHQNHLVNKDINNLIKQIAIPSMIGMFFNSMYNVVDTFYISSISTSAIAALSFSFIVFFMIISIGYSFASVTTRQIGYFLGKQDISSVNIYIFHTISLFILLGIFIFVLGKYFLNDIFVFIGAKNNILNFSLDYSNIRLFGIIPVFLNMCINAIFVSNGDTKSYRNILIIGFILNFILNPLFMYGYYIIPSYGFTGVALATVIIQWLSFIYMSFKFMKLNLIKNFTFLSCIPSITIYKKIFIQALPLSFNILFLSWANILLIYFVSNYGVNTVAGFGIGYRIEQIMLLPIMGLKVAVLTLVSNNYGANEFNRIKKIIKKSLILGYTMSFISIFTSVLFGKNIVNLFSNDLEVIQIGYIYLVVESFTFFAFSTIFVVSSTLQGIKKPLIIPYINLFSRILIPSLLLYPLIKIYHIPVEYIWIILLIILYFTAIFIVRYMQKQLNTLRKNYA